MGVNSWDISLSLWGLDSLVFPLMFIGLMMTLYFPEQLGVKKGVGGFEFWHFPAVPQENIKCLWSGSKPVDV